MHDLSRFETLEEVRFTVEPARPDDVLAPAGEDVRIGLHPAAVAG